MSPYSPVKPKRVTFLARAGVEAAVRVEGLGEQRGAGLVRHLPHRAQPVVGEVLGGGSVTLGDEVESVQVEDGRVGASLLGQHHRQWRSRVEQVGGRHAVYHLADTVAIAVVVE